ncbi:MAG: Ig-like domain-containing protein [Candidatus Binatia bacterium]
MGYGDGDEATVVSYGPNSSDKYITTYFRHAFTVPDPSLYVSLRLRLQRDDGAVVYLNGAEVRRDIMPSGSISSTTLASFALGDPEEDTFYETPLSSSNLVAGVNVLAVEIHQANVSSSDISFALELIGIDGNTVTRGPYLQRATPTSVVVRWRTGAPTDSRVSYGTTPGNLAQSADEGTLTTEHEVILRNLTPDTQYYYSVGTSTSALAGGPDFTFFTPPQVGTAQPTRIWVIGDSGTADAAAAAVRDAYQGFTGARYTDLWLMLGDNAYVNGTDAEYQAAVFNVYPLILRQSVLWPTIGNHDTAGLSSPPSTLPYFQIFTLPTNGETGGIPSGTEKYYSFDYANIHFICLDSMSSDRSPTGPMLTWLQNDLAATTQDWIIAFWHHPPYSKGSHDSDAEAPLIQMRQNVLPILEAGGVDLVLSGHSHSYERSYLLNGHYGSSNTLAASMILDNGSGREGDTGGAYGKPSGVANQGTVYAVAGSSGLTSGGQLNHPAMFIALNNLGSLVLDVNGNRLDATFLRETGAVGDYFTMVKDASNVSPVATITNPTNGATFTESVDITIEAIASDSDGSVAKVDFYASATLIGTDTTSPFSIIWTNAPAGTHALKAIATDNLGATGTSPIINITVSTNTPPAAPTGLIATAGNQQITLSWTPSSEAISYNVKRSTTSGGPYTTVASGVPVTSYTDTGLINGTTYYYVTTAVNTAGESGNSHQATATPLLPPPAAPTSLSARGVSAHQVDLTWTDNATNEASCSIERSLDGATFTEIATVGPNVTEYSDTNGLDSKTRYYYQVRAYNSGGYSSYSNTANTRTRNR